MNPMQASAPLVEGRAHFLRAADEIGRRLCRDALRGGDGSLNWMRTETERRENLTQFLLRPVGADLYQGAAGIALFLWLLHQRTGDKMQARAAEQALILAERNADGAGFYTGAAGAGCVMISIGLAQGRGDRVERGLALVARGAAAPAGPDLLWGAAGMVPVLLTLARTQARPDFLDRAIQAGEAILAAAKPGPDGLSWPGPADAGMPGPVGFAHGGSGMLPALAGLHLVTGEARWAEALTAALRHERARFDAAHGNWPDFRDAQGNPSTTPAFGTSWCHGAAGIGRSRLWLLLAGAQDPLLERELEAALAVLAASLARPPGPQATDHSYCHGLAGGGDLLIDAGLWRNRAEWTALAAGIGYRGIERHGGPRIPWPCGVRDVGEVPGLMTGLAGIGHFYLRLHDPVTTGSLLLPDPFLGTRNVPAEGRRA